MDVIFVEGLLAFLVGSVVGLREAVLKTLVKVLVIDFVKVLIIKAPGAVLVKRLTELSVEVPVESLFAGDERVGIVLAIGEVVEERRRVVCRFRSERDGYEFALVEVRIFLFFVLVLAQLSYRDVDHFEFVVLGAPVLRRCVEELLEGDQ